MRSSAAISRDSSSDRSELTRTSLAVGLLGYDAVRDAPGQVARIFVRGNDLAEIGQTLGGRYRLVELLGSGGMATVYRATDVSLGRDVALKLLRPEYLRDPDFSSRFRQEAQAAASLSHPNVVTVYDYGEDPSGPYIVMELVDGQDLATILRRNGPLPARQVARIGAGVARALAAAHARGLVHRDVKPGNVLIGSDGRVKVVDFGIARAIAEAQVTLPGMTLGSVHYFSPEQARGEPATAASDIFSLGIVLYEMLTGVRPWEGDSAASVALARLTGPIPDPIAVRSSVPTDLAAITRRALALDPNDRWPSASVMADALEATLAPSGSAAGAAGAAAVGGLAGGAAGAAAGGAAGALGGATVISATARPNPAGIPYVPDAYVGADDGLSAGGALPPPAVRGRPAPAVLEEGPRSSGALAWVAGIVAIALLIAIAFLVFQLASGGGKPPVAQVTVPTFIGLSSDAAAQKANQLGLTLSPTGQVASDQVAGTVLAQDPAPGTTVDKGTAVKITVATAVGSVPVPDLRNKDESTAVQAIFDAGLKVGVRSDDYDPIVPVGMVARQNPTAGLLVLKGTPVDYVISKGPIPTPSPTP
ncbi:MAG: eukaryotic-like serine/threonine-protein kinase, partial [Chloroflexota bacterium]|nr:eukaryotic-like serine/threonine-protein kinase [Chloroflexota bacterium]